MTRLQHVMYLWCTDCVGLRIWLIISTACPIKYSCSTCFNVFCCDFVVGNFTILQGYYTGNDCHSASIATHKDMGIWFIWITSSSVHLHGLTSTLAWVSNCIPNCIHDKVWDEITYPFPNFIGAAVEVWKWINNFTPHFTWQVIIYPWSDKSQSVFLKGTQRAHDITIMTQSTAKPHEIYHAKTYWRCGTIIWDFTAYQNKTRHSTLFAYFIEYPVHMYSVKSSIFYLEVLFMVMK